MAKLCLVPVIERMREKERERDGAKRQKEDLFLYRELLQDDVTF